MLAHRSVDSLSCYKVSNLRMFPLILYVDPAPPEVSARSHNTVSVAWPFVCFCGINPPAQIDSVQYILELSEGVDYKPGYFTRFISDVCAVDYRPVCSGTNINSTTVSGLLPAKWYHLRLSIEYLGQRFQSESQSIHTSTWVPAPTAVPRVHILPVRSSFDLRSEAPVRLEMQVSWNPSSPNGCKVLKYQCQVQRFDANGQVIEGVESIVKKEKKSKRKVPLTTPDVDPVANQWTQSPGRSALQIHNSLVLADRSPTRSRSRRGDKPGSPTTRDSRDFSPNRLPQLSDGSMLHSSASLTSTQGRRFKWEILFENILTNVRTASPTAEEAEWHLRVRAKNAEGWSDFSPVLKINKLSHPSLFVSPPPQFCYGTQYYSEHASSQYLDGTERSEFLASTPKAHVPAPDLLSDSQYGSSVKNDLFLSHHAHHSIKRAPESEKAPSRAVAVNRNKSERTERRLEPLLISPHGGGSVGSFGDNQPAPQRMHVLNFKEGNNWDAPSGSSVASVEFSQEAQNLSPKKGALPSLTPKSASTKFSRQKSNGRDVNVY